MPNIFKFGSIIDIVKKKRKRSFVENFWICIYARSSKIPNKIHSLDVIDERTELSEEPVRGGISLIFYTCMWPIRDFCIYDLKMYSILTTIEFSVDWMWLFDDNKIEMAREPGKRRIENLVGCTGDGKRWKGNINDGPREGKTGTVLELSLEVSDPFPCHMGKITGH